MTAAGGIKIGLMLSSRPGGGSTAMTGQDAPAMESIAGVSLTLRGPADKWFGVGFDAVHDDRVGRVGAALHL